MIKISEKQRSELISLWNEAFSEDEASIEEFLSRFEESGDVLFTESDGEIVSALYLLPVTAITCRRRRKSGYLYAAATRKSARGKGLMSRLVKDALLLCIEREYLFCITLPATDELYDFYAKFGFEPCLGQQTLTNLKRITCGCDNGSVSRNLTYSHYCKSLCRHEASVIKSPEIFDAVYSNPKYEIYSFADGFAVIDGANIVEYVSGKFNQFAIDSVKYKSVTAPTDCMLGMGQPSHYGCAIAVGDMSKQYKAKHLYINLMME